MIMGMMVGMDEKEAHDFTRWLCKSGIKMIEEVGGRKKLCASDKRVLKVIERMLMPRRT